MGRLVHPLSISHPDISADWDVDRNAPLTADFVIATAKDRVWWRCSSGHAYRVSVYSRVRSQGCKLCNQPAHAEKIRRLKLAKTVSLSVARPDLLPEWDYDANDIGPHEISTKSHRVVHWHCANGHRWQSTPQRRSRGDGCPTCARASAGNRVRASRLRAAGISLADAHPYLMSEWVIEANDRQPSELTPKSNYRAHWRCRFGHEWDASVVNRTHNLSGCPFCTSQTSRLEIFLLCELRTLFPIVDWRRKFYGVECDIFVPSLDVGVEVDGWYWHRNKLDADQDKAALFERYGFTLIRVRDSKLPHVPGRIVLFSSADEMLTICLALVERLLDLRPTDTAMQMYLAAGKQVNQSAYHEMISRLPAPPVGDSLNALHPELAAQWDVDANSHLTPALFSPGSEQRVGWVCAAGHRWQATIKNRTSHSSGCPECDRAGAPERTRRRWARTLGTLADANPDFLEMWDHEANGDLAPSELAATSGHRVHWRCMYGHAFVKTPSQMLKNALCPRCRSLTSVHPEIAAEWDPERNNEISPDDVTAGSSRRVWWKCVAGHRWQAVIAMRTSGTGCPICLEQRRCTDHVAASARRTQQTLTEYAPAWLSEWESALNGRTSPDEVAASSNALYWWRCDKGHVFQRSPRQRSHNSRCPGCAKFERAEAVRKAKLARSGSLHDQYPNIAAEWHPHRNGSLMPHDISSNSHRRIWWLCPHGHEWEQSPNYRVTLVRRGSTYTCSECAEQSRRGGSP